MTEFLQLRSVLNLSARPPLSPSEGIDHYHPVPHHACKKPWKMLVTVFLGTLHISLSLLSIDFLSIVLETAVHTAMLTAAVHFLPHKTFFNNCILHGATKLLCWLSLIQSFVMFLDSNAHGGVVSCMRQVVVCGTTWFANVAVLWFLCAIQCTLSRMLQSDKEQPSCGSYLTFGLQGLAACSAVFFAVCTIVQLELEEPCVYKAIQPWRMGMYISVATVVLPLAFRYVGLVVLIWKLPYSHIKHVTIHVSLAALVFIIVPWGINLWMLYISVWYFAAAYVNQWFMIAGIVALHHVSEVLEPLDLAAATLIDKQTGRVLSLCDQHKRLLKCKKGEAIRSLVVQSDLHVFETVFCNRQAPVVICMQPAGSCDPWSAEVSATWLGGSVWSLEFQDITNLMGSARAQPYEALLEDLREAVVVFDANMVVTFANAALCHLVGFKCVGDAIGKSYDSMFRSFQLSSPTNPADSHWTLAKMKHQHGTEINVYATTAQFGVGSQARYMVFAHKDDPGLRHASVQQFIDDVNDKVINPIAATHTMIADSLQQLEECAEANISRTDGNPTGELLSKHAALLRSALEAISIASRRLNTTEDVMETGHQLSMLAPMRGSASLPEGDSCKTEGSAKAPVQCDATTVPRSLSTLSGETKGKDTVQRPWMPGMLHSSSSDSSTFSPMNVVRSFSTKSDGFRRYNQVTDERAGAKGGIKRQLLGVESTSSTLFPHRSATSSLSVNNWNVMIVDDSLINQRLLKSRFVESRVFAPAKWRVICVSTGEEAVRELKHSGGFHLITMDKNLESAGGSLDGWETTVAIRAIERHNQLKPAIIIGATSHTSTRDVSEATRAGQNLVWCKPYPTAQ